MSNTDKFTTFVFEASSMLKQSCDHLQEYLKYGLIRGWRRAHKTEYEGLIYIMGIEEFKALEPYIRRYYEKGEVDLEIPHELEGVWGTGDTTSSVVHRSHLSDSDFDKIWILPKLLRGYQGEDV